MLKEFKKFAMQGNVLDMAVGIVLGMAFGKIVNSLVNDILMPPLGFVLGDVDFSSFYLNLSSTSYESLQAAQAAGAPTINYGVFANAIVNFLIIAFALFLVIRPINRFRATGEEPEPAEPSTRECPHCLSTIPAGATRCPECTSEL